MSTGDAFRKVQTGQPLRIPAAAYNAFVDAAVDLQQRRMNQGTRLAGGRPPHPGAILVRNDSGADLDRYAVVTLGTVAITAADDLEEFLAGPIFAATSPVAGKAVAILQEPTKSTAFGWAVVFGITPAKVNMTESAHVRCSATAGDTAKLASGATGPIALLWAAGTSGEQWAVVHIRDADEQVAVTSADTPVYLGAAFADTGTKDTNDITVKRQVVDVGGVSKVRLFAPASAVQQTVASAVTDAVSELGLGIAGTWRILHSGASTTVLNDDHDWRARSIEVSIVEDDDSDVLTKSSAIKWVRCPLSSDGDLIAASPYTVFVRATDGALCIRSSGGSTNPFIVWARASERLYATCDCPESGLADCYRFADYTDGDLTGCEDCYDCADLPPSYSTEAHDGAVYKSESVDCYWYRPGLSGEGKILCVDGKSAYNSEMPDEYPDELWLDTDDCVWRRRIRCYDATANAWVVIWEGQKSEGLTPVGTYLRLPGTDGGCDGTSAMTIEECPE